MRSARRKTLHSFADDLPSSASPSSRATLLVTQGANRRPISSDFDRSQGRGRDGDRR